jgi:hypothetical protein
MWPGNSPPFVEHVITVGFVTLSNSVGIYQRFGGVYRLHFQVRRVMQATNQTACLLLVSCLACSETVKMEVGTFLRKVGGILPNYTGYNPEGRLLFVQ